VNEPAALAPGEVVSGHTVVRPLGTGAAADVYEVRGPDAVPRALKLLRTTAPRKVKRMEREAEALARLSHPNVVRVHELLHHDGRLGVVLELVDGLDLERFLTVHKPSHAQLDDLAEQLFQALGAVHEAGLVHRDLKPANILVGLGEQVSLKVGDFGLALAVDAVERPRLTRSGAPLGTPAHMAPEQHRTPHKVDARADIFGLGTVLYELLTGRGAFAGRELIDVLVAVRRGSYPPITEVRTDLPQRMVQAVDAALRPRPEERPGSIDALAALWWVGERRGRRPDAWRPGEAETIRSRLGGAVRGIIQQTASMESEAPVPVAPPERPTMPTRPSQRRTLPARTPPPPAPAVHVPPPGPGHPMWWTLGGAAGATTLLVAVGSLLAAVAIGGWWWLG